MITIKDVTSYSSIPTHMIESISEYVQNGRPVGSFLEAIICNNLKEAVARADNHNLTIIPAYVKFFYNEAPSDCWGSPAKYRYWLDHKSAERLYNLQLSLEL